MKKKTEKKDGLVLSIILGIVGFLAMCGTMESQLYEAGYSGNVFLTSLYYSLKVLGASFLCLMIFPVIICLISYDFYKNHTKIIYDNSYRKKVYCFWAWRIRHLNLFFSIVLYNK